MISAPCTVSEETILAFVSGDLPEPDDLTVAEHLGVCEECRAQAVGLAALRSALPDDCDHDLVRWLAFATPFGEMFAAATDKGLVRVSWRRAGEKRGTWRPQEPDHFVAELERSFRGTPVVCDSPGLIEVERELQEYFAGARSEFSVPVDLSGISPFDRRVLEAARLISFGDVIPYAELARRIAMPGAARAVGNALGRNPVAIVVPCHRVVRTDGSLGGYGGGLEYKERLLGLESRGEPSVH